MPATPPKAEMPTPYGDTPPGQAAVGQPSVPSGTRASAGEKQIWPGSICDATGTSALACRMFPPTFGACDAGAEARTMPGDCSTAPGDVSGACSRPAQEHIKPLRAAAAPTLVRLAMVRLVMRSVPARPLRCADDMKLLGRRLRIPRRMRVASASRRINWGAAPIAARPVVRQAPESVPPVHRTRRPG